MKPILNLTAIIEESNDGWFVGQLEELPEVISQGKTLEELMDNLKDAAELIIHFRREQSILAFRDKKVFRRRLSVS